MVDDPFSPDYSVMTFPHAADRPSPARTALGYVLFAQAVASFALAGFGVLFASSYLFETDHSGMFDGLQVPIGIAICVVGIFTATVLLVTRAHVRRDGTLALTAVCIVQLVPFWIMRQDVENLIENGVRLSILAALACVVVASLSRLVRKSHNA